MEDDVNIRNKNGEGTQNDGGSYQMHHHATPDMMMNTSDRSKHYSQANSYNKQSTRSSNLTRAAKLVPQQPQSKFNPDVLTIKRDSVKFLNDKEFTTAPTIKEAMHTHQLSGTKKLEQGGKTEVLSVSGQGQQTNQSVSIIKSQFKERQGNMRYSNMSL